MKRGNWAIVIIIIIALGILVSLLVARQKAQARYILKSREADSLAFVAEALQKQVEAMVGLGEYSIETIWAPPRVDTPEAPPPDTVLVPDTILVPTYVKTISFDTTADFKWADWGIGIKAEGKFYSDSTYSDSNSLKLYPTYWRRPPPIPPSVLNIDPQLVSKIGFGIVVINDYAGLAIRFDRFKIMGMKRLGSGWAVGAAYEFWRF